MRQVKAQSALEFLITYSWAIVAILAFMAALAYLGQFNGLNYTPSECTLGLDLPCMSYRISQSNATGYEVLVMGRNDLGFDIGFENLTFNVSAENIGLAGRNNYTGNCSPSIVQRGKIFSCFAAINFTQRAPRVGTAQRAYVTLVYKNCETNPSYPTTGNCSANLTVNHTLTGWIVAQVEPATSGALCGNGVCDDNLGETNATCPNDCTSDTYTLVLTANPQSVRCGAASVITATVYDQFRRPVNGTLLNFTKSVGSGSFSASSNTTNASGAATTVFTSGSSPETVTVIAYRDDRRTFSATTPVITTGGCTNGWWDSSFAYFAPVSIFTGVSSNLSNFPARVVVDTYSLISAGKMNSSCKDMRIVNPAMNSTLDFEIENNTCDTTSTVVWVRIPQTNGTQAYSAYLFYGNATVADAQNKSGVWSNNYSGVWHLSDLSDSLATSNATNSGGASAAIGSDGVQNTAFTFDGINDFLNAGNASALNIGTNQLTVSARMRRATSSATGLLVKKGLGGGGGYVIAIGVGPATGNQIKLTKYGVVDIVAGSAPADTNWHTLVEMGNASGTYLFVDGILNGSSVNAANWKIHTEPLKIGGSNTLDISYFNGTIDEVRVSSSSRTADWLSAEFGQTSTLGSEQSNR